MLIANEAAATVWAKSSPTLSRRTLHAGAGEAFSSINLEQGAKHEVHDPGQVQP